MQSVQLPTVGILLSKKGRNSEGADVALKIFVKYLNIGSSNKCILELQFGGRYTRFWLVNEVFLPSIAGRINAMDS
jgi:hypothetical protein